MKRPAARQSVTLDMLRDAGATFVAIGDDKMNYAPTVSAIRKHVTARTQPGEKMALLFAQQHDVASHVLLPLLSTVSINQHKPGSVLSVLETPHNDPVFAKNGVGYRNEFDMSTAVKARRLKTLDRSFQLKGWNGASISNRSNIDFCLSHNVPICLSDCARNTTEQYLAKRDPETNIMIAHLNAQMPNMRIHVGSPLGMRIRNAFMMVSMISAMAETDTDICVYAVGAIHVAGHADKREEFTADCSLAHFFADAAKAGGNVNYIPIIPMSGTIDPAQIPMDALPLMKNAIIVTGMDEATFNNSNLAGELDYVEQVFLRSNKGVGDIVRPGDEPHP